MIQGHTIFFTYLLENDSGSGYTTAIHCNYIKKQHLDSLINQEVNIYFNDADDFKFLSISGGTGFTANKIYMLLQRVDNSLFENLEEVKPKSDMWKKFDVTDQIINYSGDSISPIDLVSNVFSVPLNTYDTDGDEYNLEYLNYPPIDSNNNLSFGDEELFLGNVETEIEASVYTTDLAINLPLNEYNSTTNPTWNGESDVYITEVGIYNDDMELIAIGKFNNPIKKNSTISRTIVFAIDF